MAVKKSVERLTDLRVLKKRMLELARSVEIYEELKLTLLIEGWNLDDEKVKAAVKRWLTSRSEVDRCKNMLRQIIAIWETSDCARIAARCEVMKGLWEDAVGRKDQEAARIGMMLAANVLDSSWNGLAIADKPDVRALAELVGWFGRLAYSEKKDDGCLESS